MDLYIAQVRELGKFNDLIPPISLSATGFFNCLNNNSSCFFAGKIGNRQMRDRIATAVACFCINRNLVNLYRYPWHITVNDSNFFVAFFVFSQNFTSTKDGTFMAALCQFQGPFRWPRALA